MTESGTRRDDTNVWQSLRVRPVFARLAERRLPGLRARLTRLLPPPLPSGEMRFYRWCGTGATGLEPATCGFGDVRVSRCSGPLRVARYSLRYSVANLEVDGERRSDSGEFGARRCCAHITPTGGIRRSSRSSRESHSCEVQHSPRRFEQNSAAPVQRTPRRTPVTGDRDPSLVFDDDAEESGSLPTSQTLRSLAARRVSSQVRPRSKSAALVDCQRSEPSAATRQSAGFQCFR